MKKIYSTDSVAMAWHVRNVLEQHDIVAIVKNDKLYSVSGEVPFTECWPQVWVKNILDVRRAQQLVSELEEPAATDFADWDCAACGESNLGNFDICWNCQSSSVATSDGAETKEAEPEVTESEENESEEVASEEVESERLRVL